MDSRIREALDSRDSYISLLVDELNDVVGIASIHGWVSHRGKDGEASRNRISAADAILTADPEPCEGARKVAENSIGIAIKNYDDPQILENDITIIVRDIDAYASQVADKLAEELQHQLDMSRKISRVSKDIAIRHMRKEKELREDVDTLREACLGVKKALKETELNMGNYTDDDVRHLNDGAIEAWNIVDEALAATESKP